MRKTRLMVVTRTNMMKATRTRTTITMTLTFLDSDQRKCVAVWNRFRTTTRATCTKSTRTETRSSKWSTTPTATRRSLCRSCDRKSWHEKGSYQVRTSRSRTKAGSRDLERPAVGLRTTPRVRIRKRLLRHLRRGEIGLADCSVQIDIKTR